MFFISSYDFTKHSRKTRQEALQHAYKFTCDCLACIHNYRQLTPMDYLENYGFIKPMLHSKLDNEYKIDAAKELIPKYCDFLTKKSKVFPNEHTAVAEEILFSLLSLLYTKEMVLTDKIFYELN